MLQKPLLGKTKAAEINWFAYRWREMRCDGNKGSQHTRSQVLGDSVQRRLPLRCLAISSAQQTAARCSLEGKKRVSEPSVNNLSPANGGGGDVQAVRGCHLFLTKGPPLCLESWGMMFWWNAPQVRRTPVAVVNILLPICQGMMFSSSS